jgi:hypothetical protein
MASLTEYVVELEAEKSQLRAEIKLLKASRLVGVLMGFACGFALGVFWALVWRAL